MLITFEEAVRLFEMLPQEYRFATLHPEYVVFDSMREQGAEPVFFGVVRADCLFYHGALKIPVPGTNYCDLQSAYGYGGPIFLGDAPGFVEEIKTKYQQWCRNKQIIAEFLRFHPMVGSQVRYYGELFEDRNTVFINLTGEITTGYRELTRRRLKSATKNGVEVVRYIQINEFLNVFVPMYENLMREWEAAPQYYFPHEYYRRLANWEQTILLVCRSKDGEPIAAGIFLVNGTNLEYHLGASTLRGRQEGAMYSLIDYAAHLGKGLGCTILYLGGGTNGASDNSLLFFKSGFSHVTRPYYIGRKIHLPEVYEVWRNDWCHRYGCEPNKVLFYRFTG